ncbi:MAG: hypothetical protein KAS29_05120, partial [Bacteroidales bacterium]|nr:hypothetical protein [Bacteroidales bacterium]
MKKLLVLALIVLLSSCDRQKMVDVYYDISSPTLSYGIEKLSKYLEIKSYSINEDVGPSTSSGIFILTPYSNLNENQNRILSISISKLKSDGYKIVRENQGIYIIARTERACLYAIMDIIEQIGDSKDMAQLQERQVNPAHSFRAIKFNLPWSPYR